MAWWQDDKNNVDKLGLRLSMNTIPKFRGVRTFLKSHLGEEDIKKIFELRGEEIEIFWPECSEHVEFYKSVEVWPKKIAKEVYGFWQGDLDELVAKAKSGTPDWIGKESELLQEPLRTTLLTNPNYSNLALTAAAIDAQLAAITHLHSDGCELVIDPAALMSVACTKASAIDTVTLTFALFQLTENIPKLPEVDMSNATKATLDQVSSRNCELPAIIKAALEKFRDASKA